MTKRELYIEKIKPFIDKDIIKVLTGIRRSGKSVMLKLIMEELKQNKIDEKRMMVFSTRGSCQSAMRSRRFPVWVATKLR